MGFLTATRHLNCLRVHFERIYPNDHPTHFPLLNHPVNNAYRHLIYLGERAKKNLYVCMFRMQIDIEADESQGKKKSLHHIPGCKEFEMADWHEQKKQSCHRSFHLPHPGRSKTDLWKIPRKYFLDSLSLMKMSDGPFEC
jgi:hypothetical protein